MDVQDTPADKNIRRGPGWLIVDELCRTPQVNTFEEYEHYLAEFKQMFFRLTADAPPQSKAMAYALLVNIGRFEVTNGLRDLAYWDRLMDVMLENMRPAPAPVPIQ